MWNVYKVTNNKWSGKLTYRWAIKTCIFMSFTIILEECSHSTGIENHSSCFGSLRIFRGHCCFSYSKKVKGQHISTKKKNKLILKIIMQAGVKTYWSFWKYLNAPHKKFFFYKNLWHNWKDELLVFVIVLEEVKVKVFWPYFVSNGQEKENVKSYWLMDKTRITKQNWDYVRWGSEQVISFGN